MPNAKVVGPPQAGAFKERKSGKFFYWSIRRLPSDTNLGYLSPNSNPLGWPMFKDQLHFENFTNEVISQLH